MVGQLKDLTSRFLTKLVFLTQTKINRDSMEKIKRMLNYEGCFTIEGHNNWGGVALMWKDKDAVSLLGYLQNYIDVKIQMPNTIAWRLVGFYGYPERTPRHESWRMLKNLKRRSSLTWCCICDYNDLLSLSERKVLIPILSI